MRNIHSLSLLLILPLAAACSGNSATSSGSGSGGGSSDGSGGAQQAGAGGSPRMGGGGAAQAGVGGSASAGQTGDASTGAGPTGPGSTAAATSSASSGGGVATCGDVNDGSGCCDPGGVLHYCDQNMMIVDQPCAGGQVCGWNATKKYYDCVAPPSKSDPSGQVPIACGGSGTGSTSSSSASSSSAASSSSTGGGGGTTWTQIYNTVFGPTGTSACSQGGGCHTVTKSGFKCGSSKATCYAGFVSSGLVTTGANASSSKLVSASQSPLCGSLGGNMPKGGACITAAELTEIKSWLASGAPNN